MITDLQAQESESNEYSHWVHCEMWYVSVMIWKIQAP